MLLNDVNGFLCKQVSTVLPPLSPDRLKNYNKEKKKNRNTVKAPPMTPGTSI